MRNLTKIFSVIMAVTLWLSAIVTPALAVEKTEDAAGSPTGRVVIICNKPPNPRMTCDFSISKFCNANLCKPGANLANPEPAEATLWKYKVYNGLDKPIFLEQTQEKSCQLNFPDSNKIDPGLRKDVEYECNEPIQYLANYITIKEDGAPYSVKKRKKVIFTDLTCLDEKSQ
ncbi:MAG: hypothetical protein F6J86_33435 [Symploca sp. SIO1B1]|nr:hypothetical protein [Symploca sp. SIO1B1]